MPSYIINGSEIEQVEPVAWALVLTWSQDKQSRWPAAPRDEAITAQDKISLRPTLMQRIEVFEVATGLRQAVYDSAWPRRRSAVE